MVEEKIKMMVTEEEGIRGLWQNIEAKNGERREMVVFTLFG